MVERTGRTLSAGGLVSVISATLLVTIQVLTTAVAAGWALAGLFQLGNIGEYILMVLFGAVGLYASVAYARRAVRAEASLTA